MSTVGRPSKPIAQKKVEGTYRADRDHGELEAEVLAEVPPPPKLLTTRAKQEWSIVCQWLFEKQLLAQTDLSLVAIYCNEVDRYWELEKSIKKHQKKAFSELVFPPKPDPPVFPEKCKAAERKAIERAYKSQLFEHGLTIVEMKEDQAFHYRRYKDCLSLQAMSKNTAKDYAIQFGFTPAARTRIKPPEKKKKSKLAELMEGL